MQPCRVMFRNVNGACAAPAPISGGMKTTRDGCLGIMTIAWRRLFPSVGIVYSSNNRDFGVTAIITDLCCPEIS